MMLGQRRRPVFQRVVIAGILPHVTDTNYSTDFGLIPDHRLGRCPNIKSAPYQCNLFAALVPTVEEVD